MLTLGESEGYHSHRVFRLSWPKKEEEAELAREEPERESLGLSDLNLRISTSLVKTSSAAKKQTTVLSCEHCLEQARLEC